jgi:hypothetical protein
MNLFDLMKTLYYLSYILTAPFWATAWVLYAASWCFSTLGDYIHDATTYKAWLVMQKRECERLQSCRSNATMSGPVPPK